MHSISTGTVNCAVLATSTSVLAVKRSTGVAERDPLDQPPPARGVATEPRAAFPGALLRRRDRLGAPPRRQPVRHSCACLNKRYGR